LDGACEVVVAGAPAGRPHHPACKTNSEAPGPEPTVPRGLWGGWPSCDVHASALGSRAMNRGYHSGFLDRCKVLGWFLAAAETRELGLVAKRNGKTIKEDRGANSLRYKKKKGKMKPGIIRNTSWGAIVFELGPAPPSPTEGISGNMETDGN